MPWHIFTTTLNRLFAFSSTTSSFLFLVICKIDKRKRNFAFDNWILLSICNKIACHMIDDTYVVFCILLLHMVSTYTVHLKSKVSCLIMRLLIPVSHLNQMKGSSLHSDNCWQGYYKLPGCFIYIPLNNNSVLCNM